MIPATDPECIDLAARLLAQGELVCYPTDTVYGIGAVATNGEAVRRLFAVKGRRPDNPMPILIADEAAAGRLAEVTPLARSLMSRFWPGALTIVMRKAQVFRSAALAGKDAIGLRVPDHDLLRAIIRTVGEPITGTSANRSGARAPISAPEVAFQMGEMVSLVIDGGPSRQGRESTVVDITVTPVKILREGVVSREELAGVLGSAVS